MSDLDESLTEQSLFEKQHDALMERCGEELHWNSIHKDSQAVAILEEEVRLARASNDKDVCMQCADDISDFSECSRGNEFKALEVEMLLKAAELGSPDANYRLGNRYRWGKDLPRDYEKAYVCYRKGEECDWVPIDPEDNRVVMEDGGGEVTSEFLLAESDDDIEWWLFLLENHPNRSIKCGLADWYMKQGGDENRGKALKLFEESANEGFEFAFFKLLEFYSKGEFKDLEKGRYWFEKAVELGFDEACFANELGVESLQCRKLKEAADAGDCVAAAKLACAYLHGVYDGGNEECVCCVKDLDKTRHYGVMACMGDDGGQMIVNILGDHKVEDQKFLSEVAQEAGLE